MAGACALLRLVELNYEADRLSEYGSSIFEQQLAEEWLISWARPNARRWWLDKSFFRQSICNLYTLTWIGKMRNLYKVIIYIIIKIGHMNHISVSLIPFLRKLFSHPQPYSRPCSPFVEPHFCFFEYLLQEIVHHPQPYSGPYYPCLQPYFFCRDSFLHVRRLASIHGPIGGLTLHLILELFSFFLTTFYCLVLLHLFFKVLVEIFISFFNSVYCFYWWFKFCTYHEIINYDSVLNPK